MRPGVRPMPVVGIPMGMHEPIRDHVDAIDRARDLSRLLGAAPSADGTHPSAREWVRRWSPERAAAVLPVCACAAGPCAVCN